MPAIHMTTETIDHSTLASLVEAGSVRAVRVVGQVGGWGVVVRHGSHERPLAATRSHKLRLFKRLETAAAYLHDIGLLRFDVDTERYDATSASTVRRPDRSDALKRAHAAAAHDTWFRNQVETALAEADDEATEWISDAQARTRWAEQRAALAKRVAGGD